MRLLTPLGAPTRRQFVAPIAKRGEKPEGEYPVRPQGDPEYELGRLLSYLAASALGGLLLLLFWLLGRLFW